MARARGAADVERIHQVWDELADFDASRVDEALVHAMAALSSLVGSQNAFWLGAVRLGSHNANDPLRGWRPRAIRYLCPSEPDVQFYKEAKHRVEAGQVDESTTANVRHAGPFAHRPSATSSRRPGSRRRSTTCRIARGVWWMPCS